MSDNFQSVIKIFQKHNGVMKSSQLFKLGVQPRILYTMRDNGFVLQEGRGLYRAAQTSKCASDPDRRSCILVIPKGDYLPDFCTLFSSNDHTNST